MLPIFSPKLQDLKKLSLTNSCCSFPTGSEAVCANQMQSTPYQSMSHVIAAAGCTWLCKLLVPEISAGTVPVSALGSLLRQEGRRTEKATPRTGRKSLCLINSHPKPTVRKLLHLNISKKTTAKSYRKV